MLDSYKNFNALPHEEIKWNDFIVEKITHKTHKYANTTIDTSYNG